MDNDIVNALTSSIIDLQDKTGCWNVLEKGDPYYPHCNYYVPNYKSTLWTLVLLADSQCPPDHPDVIQPLSIMADHFYDNKVGIYTIGKSHFPIPCLNGNMLYLHSYFNHDPNHVVEGIIEFFTEYQRFDDGDYKTPSAFPYHSNRSCYGNHSCFWGVVKLFKGLSFIPKKDRSKNAKKLIYKCIDFILLHHVCFSSHHPTEFLQTNIKKLTFPNMYKADFLEILWLLKREKVRSKAVKEAVDLLKSKMKPNATWELERPIKELIVPVTKRKYGNAYITERAKEVMDYYG